MSRLPITIAAFAVAFLTCTGCFKNNIPDLSFTDAADIISHAQEFNRYARLIKVERLDHQKDSMDLATFGKFTFQYLNVPADAPIIEATVDFRYHEGRWYLNQFDYGEPPDRHYVYVFDGPDKRK